MKKIKKKYYLERLTPHHKLMIEIIKDNKKVLSSNFYNFYKQKSRRQGLRPKSKRTFNNYINDLIDLNYLKVERAKVRGNVRVFFMR